MADEVLGFRPNDAYSVLALADQVGSDDIAKNNRPFRGALEYFWPPEGGIPAATKTSTTMTVGAANCFRAVRTGLGTYEKSTDEQRIENIVAFVVGANGEPIAATKNSYGCYTVVVEDCS